VQLDIVTIFCWAQQYVPCRCWNLISIRVWLHRYWDDFFTIVVSVPERRLSAAIGWPLKPLVMSEYEPTLSEPQSRDAQFPVVWREYGLTEWLQRLHAQAVSPRNQWTSESAYTIDLFLLENVQLFLCHRTAGKKVGVGVLGANKFSTGQHVLGGQNGVKGWQTIWTGDKCEV